MQRIWSFASDLAELKPLAIPIGDLNLTVSNAYGGEHLQTPVRLQQRRAGSLDAAEDPLTALSASSPARHFPSSFLSTAPLHCSPPRPSFASLCKPLVFWCGSGSQSLHPVVFGSISVLLVASPGDDCYCGIDPTKFLGSTGPREWSFFGRLSDGDLQFRQVWL